MRSLMRTRSDDDVKVEVRRCMNDCLNEMVGTDIGQSGSRVDDPLHERSPTYAFEGGPPCYVSWRRHFDQTS